MFELVGISRLNVKEQASLSRYDDHAEAVSEAERRRKVEPLTYYVVFLWVSPFCRLLCYHTM